MKAPLIEELKLKVRGVMPQERLAAMIVVGMELRHLKVVLGYMGGGCWQAYRGQVRPVWDEVCQAQAGVTEAAERILQQCACVVKARLGKVDSAEAKEILGLMDTRPSELSDEDRSRLVNGIVRHAFGERDNQVTLRREFRQNNEQPIRSEVFPSTPGDIEGQRLEIIARGMSLGLSENRSGEVADQIFRRKLAALYLKMQGNGDLARNQGGKDK